MDKINETITQEGVIQLNKVKDNFRQSDLSVCNELYFVITGEMVFKVGDKNLTVKSGQIAFMPSLTMYGYSFNNADAYRLSCGERYFADFYDCYPSMRLPYFLDDEKFNKKAFNLLREELSADGVTELEKRTALNYLLAKCAVKYGLVQKGYDSDSQIAEIVNYVHQNYDKDITLDSLAQEFCISKMVLSRKLSKHLGVDLRRFVSEVRIQAFVKLRREKQNVNVSSVELAYRCGFRSYETFYRTYKRYLGEGQ